MKTAKAAPAKIVRMGRLLPDEDSNLTFIQFAEDAEVPKSGMEAVREIPLDHDHRWKFIARLKSTPAGLEPFGIRPIPQESG